MRRTTFSVIVVALLAVVVALLAIFPWGDRDVRTRLDRVIRHVKGPWNPLAKKTSSCAPFAAVRWRGSAPEVQVRGVWYELLALDDVPAEEIVTFCKKTFGRIWRKRFEEELVVVLQWMGRQGHGDSETGSLTVRRLDTGETVVLADVAWTDANREALLRTALDAWIAGGRTGDPRDDPAAAPLH